MADCQATQLRLHIIQNGDISGLSGSQIFRKLNRYLILSAFSVALSLTGQLGFG